MPKLNVNVPKMCRHLHGHAFVKIGGQQIWLGRYGDPLPTPAARVNVIGDTVSFDPLVPVVSDDQRRRAEYHSLWLLSQVLVGPPLNAPPPTIPPSPSRIQ
jgi:hypothetical protein